MQFTLMSKQELRIAETISRVLKGDLRTKAAARIIGVEPRTIRRMKAKVRKHGLSALAHLGRGRPGNRAMDPKERKRMESLLSEKYRDFGPTLAAEKLLLLHGIDHDPKTIRSAMIALGHWKARHRSVGTHREWRERRAMFGDLLQYDGSYHAWLEDRWIGPDGSHELCLLLAIDDATGRVTRACFAPHEGLLPTLGFWLRYGLERGLPAEIYVDRFSTYKMHMKAASENEDTKTQFGRVMDSLGVKLIFAHSPQAKGRVERVFGTLQDRLVKELRLAGISTPDAADAFITETFLPVFNAKFAVAPREAGDLHRRLTAGDRKQVVTTFCREDRRTVCGDSTISHDAVWHQLCPTPRLHVRPKDVAIVRTSPDGEVTVWIRGKQVITRIIEKGRRRFADELILKKRTFLIPAKADISISR